MGRPQVRPMVAKHRSHVGGQRFKAKDRIDKWQTSGLGGYVTLAA